MNNRYDDLFTEADEVFNGEYSKELNELLGLSKVEIDSLIPGTADVRTYYILIKIVEKAIKDNSSLAVLVDNIKELGELGIKIAKKIPRFADLL